MADQDPRGRHAVVAGAGIGGVTAALALARRGWRVTIVERAAELGEVGAGISVWPGALGVLDELGVTSRLVGETVRSGQGGLRLPDGRWLVVIDSAKVSAPTMVHRARLHEAIRTGLDTAELRTGVTVTDLRQDEESAALVTEHGEEIRGDVVIGADGLRSVVRSALYPDRADIGYSGYTAYRGIAPIQPGGPSAVGGETWGIGARFGYVPLTDGRTYWYATANTPAANTPAANTPAANTAAGDTDGDHHADASQLLAGWHDPIGELLAATPPDAVLRNDIYDLRVPLAPFARGRVALLGDAAHAMTPNLGQGACAAIEDAGVLARMLDEHPTPGAALAAYDAKRRPATSRLVRRSRQVGRLGQLESPVALAMRDTVLRAVGLVVRVRAGRSR